MMTCPVTQSTTQVVCLDYRIVYLGLADFGRTSSKRPPTLVFITRAMATASKDRKEKVGVSENLLFSGAGC